MRRAAPGPEELIPKWLLTHLVPSAPFFSLHSKQKRKQGCYSSVWGDDPGDSCEGSRLSQESCPERGGGKAYLHPLVANGSEVPGPSLEQRREHVRPPGQRQPPPSPLRPHYTQAWSARGMELADRWPGWTPAPSLKAPHSWGPLRGAPGRGEVRSPQEERGLWGDWLEQRPWDFPGRPPPLHPPVPAPPRAGWTRGGPRAGGPRQVRCTGRNGCAVRPGPSSPTGPRPLRVRPRDHGAQKPGILLETSSAGSPASGLAPPPCSQPPGTHGVSGFSFLSRQTRLPSFSLEHRADQGQGTLDVCF